VSDIIYEAIKRTTVAGGVQTATISGFVKGDSYKDAKAGITRLEDQIRMGGRMEIKELDMAGSIVSMETRLAPNSNYQAFDIILTLH
jgi:hypothetical protein